MSAVVIKLENVSKFYKLYKEPRDRLKEALHPFKKKYHKPFYALKGLDLEIKRGDVLGVVGRNGCGKSTLLKLITGVLQPSEGSISVTGKITALLELGAGFNPEFTGIENIRFYAKILGITDKMLKEKLPQIIAFAELGDFLYQPVSTYSSGMKSRLGFAVAVHVDPEILILDEVLAVGDALFKRKCYAKMEEFFKAGKTIIYVSHDANSVNRLCNRAVLIYQGDIIMDGSPKAVTKQYEKLLFTDQPSVVSEEIKESGNNLPEKNLDKNSVKNKEETPELNDGYIPGFESKALLEYGDGRAKVTNVRLENSKGERVNVLVAGREYSYKFDATFASAEKNIGYGMKLKAENGLELTGASTHFSEDFDTAENGETKEMVWNFTCNILEGTYYMNLAVTEHIGSELTYLVRNVDVLVFKVIAPKRLVDKGLVYLNMSYERSASD